jgi:hypothetical protein
VRHVRGTPLDVFGYARHRREERKLADEYAGLVDAAISRLEPDTYAAAVELARSVATIRGLRGHQERRHRAVAGRHGGPARRGRPQEMTAYKVVRFLGGEPSQAEVLRARWTRALAAAADRAPTTGRPRRVALAVPLELPDLSPPRFAAIDLQWFADARGAHANEVWLETIDPDLCLGSSLFAAGSGQVVAEEVVRRGSEYLDTRREVGGERYKMMSFGKRNPR